MPEPTTVWLSRPGSVRDLRGTLSLEGERLSFAGDGGERLSIPRGGIQSARRHRATPVLEVAYEAQGEPRTALFFFVEPPPHPDVATAPPGPFGRWSERSRRAGEMTRLRKANKLLKGIVQGWAEALGN